MGWKPHITTHPPIMRIASPSSGASRADSAPLKSDAEPRREATAPAVRESSSKLSHDRLLRLAIAEKRLLEFHLDGRRKIVEPHDYGIHKGVARLFCYQVDGESRSKANTGWRWAELSKISRLHILQDRFSGPRTSTSGRHIQWDALFATVSPRPTSRPGTPTVSTKRAKKRD